MADNGLRCELLMGETWSSLVSLIQQGYAESLGKGRGCPLAHGEGVWGQRKPWEEGLAPG